MFERASHFELDDGRQLVVEWSGEEFGWGADVPGHSKPATLAAMAIGRARRADHVLDRGPADHSHTVTSASFDRGKAADQSTTISSYLSRGVLMSRLKSAVMQTRLYPAAHSLYRSLFRRDAKGHRARMGAFYSQFFQVGDVIFDLGANQGEYAEVFAGEGARVVAVEPNAAFTVRLRALAREADIRPVFAAVGDKPGTAVLNVCSEPGFSTLVDPGIEWIEKSPDYETVSWTHTLEVPVTTVDLLARDFGEPEYIKIDVEGFEINVLRSMTLRPRYLSFEYGARRKDASLECLEHLGNRAYAFRPIVGREYRFATREWMSVAEATDWLAAFSVEQAEYGDMFAHRL